MRFNLRFVMLYVMPWVAIVASVWSYPGNLSLDTPEAETPDGLVRAAFSYFVTVLFCFVWVRKAKRTRTPPEDV